MLSVHVGVAEAGVARVGMDDLGQRVAERAGDEVGAGQPEAHAVAQRARGRCATAGTRRGASLPT